MEKNSSLSTNIVGPPRPDFKAETLEKVIGKTVSAVEFGEEATHPEAHTAESIILRFDDGTAMSVVVGSNAGNLVGQKIKRASDMHTDLMVFWEER